MTTRVTFTPHGLGSQGAGHTLGGAGGRLDPVPELLICEHGIACVTAVGDDGGPIAWPAAVPGVLAVSAIGQLGSFPPDSGIAAGPGGI